jgi:hypothetical protein
MASLKIHAESFEQPFRSEDLVPVRTPSDDSADPHFLRRRAAFYLGSLEDKHRPAHAGAPGHRWQSKPAMRW